MTMITGLRKDIPFICSSGIYIRALKPINIIGTFKEALNTWNFKLEVLYILNFDFNIKGEIINNPKRNLKKPTEKTFVSFWASFKKTDIKTAQKDANKANKMAIRFLFI